MRWRIDKGTPKYLRRRVWWQCRFGYLCHKNERPLRRTYTRLLADRTFHGTFQHTSHGSAYPKVLSMVLVQHGTHDGERAKFSALFQSTLNGMALSKRFSTTVVFPSRGCIVSLLEWPLHHGMHPGCCILIASFHPMDRIHRHSH